MLDIIKLIPIFTQIHYTMPNDSIPTLIRFSGIDYSNRIRPVLSDLEGIVSVDGKPDLYNWKNGVSFDFTEMVSGPEVPKGVLGTIWAGLDNYFVCSKEKNGIAYFIDDLPQKKIAESFKRADVLIFSGHHYGSDYNSDPEKCYKAPGLTSSTTFKVPVAGCGYFCAPAFDLGTLWSEMKKDKTTFGNVKIVISLSCNFIRENVFPLFKNLFPNAVILGYHGYAPAENEDERFLVKFLKDASWDTVVELNKLADDASDDEKKPLTSKMIQYFCQLWHDSLPDSRYNSEPGYFYVENGAEKGAYYSKAAHDKAIPLGQSPQEFKSRVTRFKDFDLKAKMEELAKNNKA